MLDYFKKTVVGQFEASLAMMNQCIAACPEKHWEDKIANGPVRWVAYHTLFFTDLYLTPNEKAFELRELHHRGGDEREPVASVGLPKAELLTYVPICRQKAIESIAAETEESLAGPSGFSWYKCTRGELHLISIRHIQHHTGQISAFVRRVSPTHADLRSLPWIATGWR
jgi:DinB family protein